MEGFFLYFKLEIFLYNQDKREKFDILIKIKYYFLKNNWHGQTKH
jgi:hypothetical protein